MDSFTANTIHIDWRVTSNELTRKTVQATECIVFHCRLHAQLLFVQSSLDY